MVTKMAKIQIGAVLALSICFGTFCCGADDQDDAKEAEAIEALNRRLSAIDLGTIHPGNEVLPLKGRSAKEGILWDSRYVSAGKFPDSLELSIRSTGETFDRGDKSIEIGRMTWSSAGKCYEADGWLYLRTSRKCPIRRVPAKFVLEMTGSEPLRGALSRITAGYTDFREDDQCNRIDGSEHEATIAISRLFTMGEYAAAIRKFEADWAQSRNALKADLERLKAVAATLPPQRQQALLDVSRLSDDLCSRIDRLFEDTRRAITDGGKLGRVRLPASNALDPVPEAFVKVVGDLRVAANELAPQLQKQLEMKFRSVGERR